MLSENNIKKKEDILKLIDQNHSRTLRKGFFGEVIIRYGIQDGSIQDVEGTLLEKLKK